MFSRIGKLSTSWLLFAFVWYSASSTAVSFLPSASAASLTSLASSPESRLLIAVIWSRTSRIVLMALCVSLSLSRAASRNFSWVS